MSDGPSQEIRIFTGADGVRIACATSGTGVPLVRVAHWLSHLEFDLTSPVWRDFLFQLAQDRLLVRYDERGTGLSDRDVADITFEAMVADLELVVDELGLERFALLGMSQGAAIGIAYAVRHPERVTGLVICGGYARGHAHRGRSADQVRDAALLLQLIRAGWGTPNPKFRRVFATMFLPDGSAGLYAAFDELQRVSATPDVAYRLRGMFDSIDVTRLCGQVLAPTLVMHLRDDGVVPFEEGRLLAALIPGSRFVPLEGTGHILVPGTRGWTTFFHELGSFLEAVVATDSSRPLHAPLVASRSGGDPAVELLTRREREVMAAVADGQTNTEIAEVMGISPRTIERHLANVYSKLGLEGKAARAAASARVARSEVREERRG